MRRFLLKLVLFMGPILIFVIPPACVLLSSGENFKSVDDVIAGPDKYLIGYAYNQNNYRYIKWKTANIGPRPEVMAVGSSRVLQFRSNMFIAPFYNAGYTISSIKDFTPFLQSIQHSKYPKILIIGLDQWMFNETWSNQKAGSTKNSWSKSFTKTPGFTTLQMAWGDLLSGKYPLYFFNDQKAINKIGIQSILNNSGLRNDGSMLYGDQIKKLMSHDSSAADFGYGDTYGRIAAGDRGFEYGENIDAQARLVLTDFLLFCKNNDIHVVAILPPFADGVYEKMKSSGKYAYLGRIYPELLPVFKKHDFELYDFSTVKWCGSDDYETLDGFHGSEFTYLKMLIRILESGSRLNSVADTRQLKDLASKSLNKYEVYSP